MSIDHTTLPQRAAVTRPDVAPLKVMGVLNATPDSFWSGSRYEAAQAIAVVERMFADGAWVVDVGGESTRPGAAAVSADEELDRIGPIVSALATRGWVSVDTRHAEVAEEAVRLGASIINDVSGTLHQVAARLGVGYVGMHSTAVPVLAGDQPSYDDVLAEVSSQLVDIAALSKGAAELWIDPGIGFGKGVQDNLSLLRHLPELCSLGVPVLLGFTLIFGVVRIRGHVRRRLLADLIKQAINRHPGVIRVDAEITWDLDDRLRPATLAVAR